MTYQMKKKKIYQSVEDIFSSDEFGLFDNIKPIQKKSQGDSLRMSNFEKINEFLDTHKRKPKDTGSFEERSLAVRLSAYRNNPTEDVIEIDRYGLLDGFITKSDTADQAISAIGTLGDKKNDSLSSNDAQSELVGQDTSDADDESTKEAGQDVLDDLDIEDLDTVNLDFFEEPTLDFFEEPTLLEEPEDLFDCEECEKPPSIDESLLGDEPAEPNVHDASISSSKVDDFLDERGDLDINLLWEVSPGQRVKDEPVQLDSSEHTDTPSELTQHKKTFGSQQELDVFATTAKDTEYHQSPYLRGFEKDTLPLEAGTPAEARKGLFYDSRWNFSRSDDVSSELQKYADENQSKDYPSAFIRSMPDELGFYTSPSNETKDTNRTANKVSDQKRTAKQDGSTTTESLAKPTSLDDLLNKVEGLGLLDDVRSDIFDIPDELAVLRTHNTSEDDVIGKRDVCLDFDRFADIFKFISKAMSDDKYTRHDFVREKSIHIGSVFVIGGLTAYVADKYIAEDRDGKNSRNERLRLVFSNGTESNILAFSLTTAQYREAGEFYQVEITDPDWIDLHFADGFAGSHADIEKLSGELSEQEEVEDEGEVSGVIYVARLIERPDVLYHHTDLHKIGMTKGNGHERTKKSVGDATFLHREVEIIAEWKVVNANVYKVESFLHKFFHHANVNMSVVTRKNNVHGAREWFDVPLNEIEKAINLIVQGDIVKYTYNKHSKRIEPKKQ